MPRHTLHGPTMGTRWSATCELPAESASPALRVALHAALAATVQQVDAQMSPWQPSSALNRFNHTPVGQWVALESEMLQVLAAALQVCQASGGAFDPGVGALVNAWGFGPERSAPDAAAIQQARQQPYQAATAQGMLLAWLPRARSSPSSATSAWWMPCWRSTAAMRSTA